MSLRDIINDEEKLRDVARVGFENVDTDKSGYIDIKELGKVMTDISKDLGVDPPTPEDIQEVMTITNVDRVPFGFIKSPVNNRKASDRNCPFSLYER